MVTVDHIPNTLSFPWSVSEMAVLPPMTTSDMTTNDFQAESRKTALSKKAVVLLNLGGPDTIHAVEPFLYNLFSDPDIFKFPFAPLTQGLFARLISKKRAPEAKENYAKIGANHLQGSPILPMTEAQANALSNTLQQRGYPIDVAIAMRYWHPLTEATVKTLLSQGKDHLYVLPLYPHFSFATTGSSVNELKRQLKKQLTQTHPAVKLSIIPSYHTHLGYLAALAETIEHTLQNNPWSCAKEEVTILFSAHSLPKKYATKMQDPYESQIQETATSVMQQHFPHNPWDLAYQSKVGKMVWIGPDTEGVLHYYAATGIKNVLVVPISFTNEHIETLYEIDMLYGDLAKDLGIEQYHRAPCVNTNETFINALAEMVMAKIEDTQYPHLAMDAP